MTSQSRFKKKKNLFISIPEEIYLVSVKKSFKDKAKAKAKATATAKAKAKAKTKQNKKTLGKKSTLLEQKDKENMIKL